MTEKDKSMQNILWISYCFMAVGIVGAFIFPVIGVVVAYIKKSSPDGGYLADHLDNITSSFWILSIGMVVGWLLSIIIIGYAIMFLSWLYYTYNIIKGIARLKDDRNLTIKTNETTV
jgi:uncharacterized membrane protein